MKVKRLGRRCVTAALRTFRKKASRRRSEDHNPNLWSCEVAKTKQFSVISESGLYKRIMRSDKPEAKAFQDWVTREVLPSIRKTGSYSVQSQQATLHKITAESGPHRLIIQSAEREAKTFQGGATGDVLPSIKKTGGLLLSHFRHLPVQGAPFLLVPSLRKSA